MKKDPDEMHNVIDDPAYSEIATKLKKELKQLMIDVGDTASLDEFREISEKDFGKLN
jgi:hypothetical protein